MSHITTINVEISDLNALSEACDELGVKLMRNQKSFRWYGSRNQGCDHAITIPGNSSCYEIGVIQKQKKYELQWDQFAGAQGMVAKVGRDAMGLIDHYGASVAKKQLKRQGYKITQSIGQQGQVILDVS